MPNSLATALARMEGYYVSGSIAQRQNNPGNLRSSPLASGSSGGFAVFPDAATGWQALDRQIALDASRGLTLEQFISKYAPPSENNTSNYLDFLVAQTGIQPGDMLSAAIGTTTPDAGGDPLTLPGVEGLALSDFFSGIDLTSTTVIVGAVFLAGVALLFSDG